MEKTTRSCASAYRQASNLGIQSLDLPVRRLRKRDVARHCPNTVAGAALNVALDVFDETSGPLKGVSPAEAEAGPIAADAWIGAHRCAAFANISNAAS